MANDFDDGRFSSIGFRRGPCGHIHRTLRGAIECIHLDGRALRAKHPKAWSDRVTVRVEPGFGAMNIRALGWEGQFQMIGCKTIWPEYIDYATATLGGD